MKNEAVTESDVEAFEEPIEEDCAAHTVRFGRLAQRDAKAGEVIERRRVNFGKARGLIMVADVEPHRNAVDACIQVHGVGAQPDRAPRDVGGVDLDDETFLVPRPIYSPNKEHVVPLSRLAIEMHLPLLEGQVPTMPASAYPRVDPHFVRRERSIGVVGT